MAFEISSPNMDLPVPSVGQTSGTQYATDVNTALGIIDAHNHTPGSGVLVPVAGLNINADLPINGNNLILTRSLRFLNNLTPIPSTSPDQGCLYTATISANHELFYNDSVGHQVQLTNNGLINATSSGIESGTATAAFVSGTLVVLSAPATPGTIDAGTLIVRYPGSYPTPAGNYIALEAPSTLASGYALTLPALPAQTNVMTLGATGIIGSITYDNVGQDMTFVGANAIANTRTRAVSSTVSVGGVAISSSCGAFSSTNGTNVLITNLSVTITTSGRPIWVGFISDGTGNLSTIGVNSTDIMTINILNNSSIVGTYYLTSSGSLRAPASGVNFIDVQTAGTYTYTVEVTTAGLGLVNYTKLAAYEL